MLSESDRSQIVQRVGSNSTDLLFPLLFSCMYRIREQKLIKRSRAFCFTSSCVTGHEQKVLAYFFSCMTDGDRQKLMPKLQTCICITNVLNCEFLYVYGRSSHRQWLAHHDYTLYMYNQCFKL
jgi:hypothetical protein